MGNQLRERRLAAGLSQQALADLAQASRSSLKFLEGGYSPPRSAVRDRIEHVLNELEATSGSASASTEEGCAAVDARTSTAAADPDRRERPSVGQTVARRRS